MSDPFAPPPRRQAPEPLRQEIARRLSRASAPHRRLRLVLLPLAAVVMTGTVAVGSILLGRQHSAQPIQTASPYPTTASQTPPWRTATTPTPAVTKASTNIDVRPMSKREIEADTRSCMRPVPHDNTPRQGARRVLFATVQIQAGVSGPVSHQARTLVLRDDVGTWICENGAKSRWLRGSLTTVDPGNTQMAAYDSGRTRCRAKPQVTTSVLFAVGEEVSIGRTRINLGSSKGSWQTSRPSRGMVNFRLVLDGSETRIKPASMEFELLDRRGDRVTIHRNDKTGGPDTGKTAKLDIFNCVDFEKMTARFKPPRPEKRPVDDEAGITTCLELVKESATNRNVPFGTKWKPRLVISTKQEWGAVLSDGTNLVGCSLFPTKEISPFSPDTARVAQSSFYFAVNPIGSTPAASLWAAGKVPTDVSAISYRLPGGRDVTATLDENGYWMLMYNSGTTPIADGANVADWDPVEVTVTRPGGTKKFSINFTEETMCRQVSHGC
jgi:hypothetical protein